MNKLVVLGSVNADHVLHVSSFPRPGETLHGHDYSVIPGGKGANQAVAAARLGADVASADGGICRKDQEQCNKQKAKNISVLASFESWSEKSSAFKACKCTSNGVSRRTKAAVSSEAVSQTSDAGSASQLVLLVHRLSQILCSVNGASQTCSSDCSNDASADSVSNSPVSESFSTLLP